MMSEFTMSWVELENYYSNHLKEYGKIDLETADWL